MIGLEKRINVPCLDLAKGIWGSALEIVKKISSKFIKQKTRLHHQHKNWERNDRDYGCKDTKNM